MQSIVEGTSVEESNKRVAGHMPRKNLVRKLGQLGYSRDEISAVTGHSNIKSLNSYLDTMNERKSTELSLAVSGISRGSSAGAKSKQQHKFRFSARRPRRLRCSAAQHVNNYFTDVFEQQKPLLSLHSNTSFSPFISLSSIRNNITCQATINITFNIQPPQ